jgi:mRNA interferase MazF
MKKGNIVLIPFPFTDLSGNKTRPALVLAVDTFDITVAFITSKVIKQEVNDLEIIPSKTNGLKIDSIIKLNKIATIETSLALGELGTITNTEISEINKKQESGF